jgi:hypothetical protein
MAHGIDRHRWSDFELLSAAGKRDVSRGLARLRENWMER